MSMDVEVNFGKIIDQEKITATETTYTLDGGYKISGEYLIGPEQPATVVKGVGTVLSILQSKWGFLFLIVLPALIAFLYQIGVVVSELRGTNGGKDKNYNEEQ